MFVDPELWRSVEMQPPFDRRSLPAYATLALMAVMGLCLCAALRFSISAEIWPRFFGPPAAIIVGGWGLRRLGKPQFAGVMETMGLVYLEATPAFLCLVPLTAISAPLADGWLSLADRALGFDWMAYYHAMLPVGGFLVFIYKAILWQPALVSFTLFLTGRSDRGWQFTNAAVIAMAISTALYAFAPAVGSTVYYSVQPLVPVEPFAPILIALKEGYRAVDRSSFTGLISFPSYHAAAAVMFTWALWPTRLRWPVLVINVLMTASAIVVGSHYLIDILAGCIVGAVAISAAGRLVNRSASAKSSPSSLPQAPCSHLLPPCRATRKPLTATRQSSH